jgi:hypothetical protein
MNKKKKKTGMFFLKTGQILTGAEEKKTGRRWDRKRHTGEEGGGGGRSRLRCDKSALRDTFPTWEKILFSGPTELTFPDK